MKKLLGLLCCLPLFANAGIITNGSFESNDVRRGGWSYFSSNDVQGWQGHNIEIWDNLFNINAVEGDQFIELNAHCSGGGSRACQLGKYSIYQDFASNQGQQYSFGLSYRARTNRNESFQVSIEDSVGNTVYSQLLADHNNNSWRQFSGTFVANDNWSRIRLDSMINGSLGNLIDNVYVEAIPVSSFSAATFAVSEPASIILLIFALAALIILRKKRAD
ncbi:DUF642 domain-containing protein [Agarivorans sp. DSG3-1]|uniref:DUF642 domain-containing protein n=1 Tax=Agarivorans sp. DSG3-1 TaxID=3342249 RepID=UPI00398F65C0